MSDEKRPLIEVENLRKYFPVKGTNPFQKKSTFRRSNPYP